MSDEPTDKPSKLRLSRDLKSEKSSDEAPKPISMKLKRSEPETEPENKAQPTAPATPPVEVNKPQMPAPVEPQSEATPPTAATSGDSFDPKNPFGSKQSSTETETNPATLPPPLPPVVPAKTPETQSSPAQNKQTLEERVEEVSEGQQSSFLPSIIVIIVLLLVIGGAGYGLWLIIKDPNAAVTTETEAVENSVATHTNTSEAAPKKANPIERARAAIEKVPVADVDAITGSSTPIKNPEPAPATPAAPMAPARVTEAASEVASPSIPKPIESSKKLVTAYLSGIHIGGMRKGATPKVIIDGQSFELGDIVHVETGLRFDGFRDGRLAFRDSNDIVYLKSF